MRSKAQFGEHRTCKKFSNKMQAVPMVRIMRKKDKQSVWRIVACKWMDNGRGDKGNPHYHVVKVGKKGDRTGSVAPGSTSTAQIPA